MILRLLEKKCDTTILEHDSVLYQIDESMRQNMKGYIPICENDLEKLTNMMNQRYSSGFLRDSDLLRKYLSVPI